MKAVSATLVATPTYRTNSDMGVTMELIKECYVKQPQPVFEEPCAFIPSLRFVTPDCRLFTPSILVLIQMTLRVHMG